MRKLMIAGLAASALMGAACDEEGFQDAKRRRMAATPTKSAATATAKPDAPKKPVRRTIKADDKKSYAALPAVFANADNPVTEEKITLGRMLYYETRLSKNHDVSCNSCHLLDKFGVDNQPTSPGHKGQRGGRNSPTVYNAGGYIAQFWDGRAKDLEEQAKGPILNPVEMAMADEASVVRTLKSMPGYVDAFKAAFPDDADAVSYDNMAKAIGAFERKLVTPGRFDAWLGGKEDALTDQEVNGFARFIELGCPTCHVGPAVGGTSYQKLGLVKPWPDQSDLGRFEVTEDESDKMKFRVPSLRNIEKTGPYFHKGQLSELEDVVRKMAWHQLGQELSDEDAGNIVAFLKSLTGKLPTDYIAAPTLPESTDATPEPDPS
jgi:cytochrome c peroxidase